MVHREARIQLVPMAKSTLLTLPPCSSWRCQSHFRGVSRTEKKEKVHGYGWGEGHCDKGAG